MFPKGMVIPVFKKGDNADVLNNYRCITLISCFAKLFTIIINERLKKWSIEFKVNVAKTK
jgi:hypothetical protein